MHQHPQPPSTRQLLMEFPRAGRDLMRLGAWGWQRVLKQAPQGDGHPVMTIPGFGGGDGSMALLRRYLEKQGYQSHPWGLGTNIIKRRMHHMDEILGFCANMEMAIVEKAEKLVSQSGEKVSLIGWSLGGVYANVLAQTHPHLIRQVITLGSPVGDPRGTSTWDILKKLTGSSVPDEQQNVAGWVARKESVAERQVRTTILYSLTDGAVSSGSAVIEGHDLVENIQVPSSHVGFAHNPVVYWVIADRLSQREESWQPFSLSCSPKKIQKAF